VFANAGPDAPSGRGPVGPGSRGHHLTGAPPYAYVTRRSAGIPADGRRDGRQPPAPTRPWRPIRSPSVPAPWHRRRHHRRDREDGHSLRVQCRLHRAAPSSGMSTARNSAPSQDAHASNRQSPVRRHLS